MEIRDSREQPFAWFDNIIIDEYAVKLGPIALSVYMALVRHANNRDQTCYPSYDILQSKLGLARGSVADSLKRLEDIGLIERHQRRIGPKGRATNVYTILHIPSVEVSSQDELTMHEVSSSHRLTSIPSETLEKNDVSSSCELTVSLPSELTVSLPSELELEVVKDTKKDIIRPSTKPSRKKPQTVAVPETVIPSSSLIKWHQDKFPQYDLDDAIDACLDHYRKKGEEAANYEAAIRNWFRTGHKYGTLQLTKKPKKLELNI